MSLAAKLGMPQIADMIMDFGLRPETSAPMTEWRFREVFPVMNSADFDMDSIFFQWIERFWKAETISFEMVECDRPIPVIHVASEIGNCDYLDILVRHNFQVSSVCAAIAIATAPDVWDFLRKLSDLGVAMTTDMLAIAIQNKSFHILEWLVHQDINFNRSPLEEAVRGGHREIMERLLYLGVKVNNHPYCVGGATALQAAAIEGYSGILRRLIELNADPNALGAESYGRTALEGAAEHGRLDVVQILLSSGVKTHGSGRRQYVRAIAYARHHGHHAVAELLTSHRPWEEADQEILDEKDLLNEDQSPQKIAEGQRVSSESDDDFESSDEVVSFDPESELFEDGHQIQEDPGPLIGGLRVDGDVSEVQSMTHNEQVRDIFVEQQVPTGHNGLGSGSNYSGLLICDQAMQDAGNDESLSNRDQGPMGDTIPDYEGNELEILTSLVYDQAMQRLGDDGNSGLVFTSDTLGTKFDWSGVGTVESWDSVSWTLD
ncbi:Ankyrin-1-like protein 2 [Colletotrichum chrysophilum]|uniref:Ankyrin-1-like protein 2 n=1 Tax=Colletotrichum chrysophilum TaxID=1836956 RepID=A0AAD9AR24_9PEZI|nr:Ankyrin-1-like protein 2 [Colletotrichum chrysophilum]